MLSPDIEQDFQKYAEIIVGVGLNLQPGQRLMIQAPLESAPLVRRIAASAYQAGCQYVDVALRDEQITLIRYQNARRDSFGEFPGYYAEGMLRYAKQGDAFLGISGGNPDLLKDQDPELIAQAQKVEYEQLADFYQMLSKNKFNWAIVGYPTLAWANKVFPEEAETGEGENRLWRAIYQVCRVYSADPVDAWRKHVSDLLARCAYMTAKQYKALKYSAPGTDLTVGLSDGHRWMGGGLTTDSKITFTPNLPTEEIFTMPHKQRVDGVVSASKPLSYGGNLIEGFHLRFENGCVVEAGAKKGEEMLRKLLETDEGATRLGEAALVPVSSPVSRSGMMFFNTLFDENAACHLALGRGFEFCLQGDEISDEQYEARGGNTSLAHVDFMIGSPAMDIDGVTEDGGFEPVMRAGEWAFTP